MDDAKTARQYAHECLEAADNITDTATKVLRSLRRGNDDWRDLTNPLERWQAILAEARLQSKASDDAEDARTEEA